MAIESTSPLGRDAEVRPLSTPEPTSARGRWRKRRNERGCSCSFLLTIEDAADVEARDRNRHDQDTDQAFDLLDGAVGLRQSEEPKERTYRSADDQQTEHCAAHPSTVAGRGAGLNSSGASNRCTHRRPA